MICVSGRTRHQSQSTKQEVCSMSIKEANYPCIGVRVDFPESLRGPRSSLLKLFYALSRPIQALGHG